MSNRLRVAISVILGILAIIYGASPVDAVPEVVFGPLGLADDATVVIGAIFAIWKLLSGRDLGASGSVPPKV